MADNHDKLEHLIKDVAKAYLADRDRWRQNDAQWLQAHERFLKIEALIQQQNTHIAQIYTQLQKHDGKFAALQKAIHRMLEGRSS